MPVNEWYKNWFSSPYYEILYLNRNEQEATDFINCLLQHLHPQPGSTMLDVACGRGRHSRVLAKQGFDVTGLDLSQPQIEYAQQYEAENLHFFVHDMRTPFRINYFDYAFNFFTSFGYFRTAREHTNAVRATALGLKKGGVFVVDYLNVLYAENRLVKDEVKQAGDVVFNITRWQDESHFFKRIEITDGTRPGLKETFTERVAKFSPGEFTDMLAHHGLQVTDIFGDYSLGLYDIKTSPRMIILAKKMRY